LEYSGTGAAVLADVNGWPPNKLPVFSELSGDLHNLVQQAENGDVKAQRAFRNAGRRMGAGIDAIVALLAPQRIILAGETGRQPDFIEGVRMALSERKTPLCESSLVVGQATSAQASSAIALDQFFLTSNLEQVYTG
jgi:predicted NBD/HSP70 family sugar kinase